MNNTLVVYYSVFGSTKTVAEVIADTVNADIKEIELVKPYSKVGAYTKGVVHSIHGHQKLLEIKNVIDISGYDTLYIGAPVWNYTVNIALQSWLSQVDLTGKKVIPFCTNDGDLGDYFEKMDELCKKASSVEKGWQVVAGARTVEKIPKSNYIHAVKMDVTDSASNQKFVAKALEQFGRIDVLINNAGYGEYGPTEEISLSDARYQFDVNYFAAVDLSNLVLPTMRKQRSGRIVNISSIGGDAYTPLGAHYNASKAALQQWSDVLDSEIRQFGLRSVIVQPGGTKTGWQAIAFDRTDQNTTEKSPYKPLVNAVASVMNGVEISASADDLARVFYKAATEKKPKRRYYNSFGNRMYSWMARVFPGVLGGITNTFIYKKMK